MKGKIKFNAFIAKILTFLMMLSIWQPILIKAEEVITAPSFQLEGKVTTASVILTWKTITGAIDYEVEADGTVVSVGTETTYIHSDLKPESAHNYRVRLKDSKGVSNWSDMLSLKTEAETSKDTNDSNTINNNDSTNNNSTSNDSNSTNNNDASNEDSSTNNSDITSDNNTTNNNDTTNDSSTVSETLELPKNIKITSSYTKIILSWDSVANATGYDIEVDGNVIDNGNNTKFTSSNLSVNTEHSYKVRAKNSESTGEWSETVTKKTLETKSAYINVDGQIKDWTNIDAIANSNITSLYGVQDRNNLYLMIKGNNIGNVNKFYIDSDNNSNSGNHNENWTNCGADYYIEDNNLYKYNIGNWTLVEKVNMIKNSEVIELLIPLNKIGKTSPGEMKITYQGESDNFVPSKGSEATSTDIVINEVLPKPTSPTELTVTEKSQDSVSLSWKSSTSVGGDVEYNVYNGTQLVGTTKDTRYKVTGLTANTNYTFTVKAKDVLNTESDASNEVSVTTDIIIPKPTNIKTTSTSDSVNFTWDSVKEITGYDVEVDGFIINNKESTTFTKTGLLAGAEVKFRVRGKYENKTGEWSDLITAKSLPFFIPTPDNIKTASTSASIGLMWNEVKGATGYQVEVDGIIVDNGASTSYFHNGLTSGSSHNYRVRTKSNDVYSEWSKVITVSAVVSTTYIKENTTLDKDMIYGDLSISVGTLDLNKYNIKIVGSVTQTGGILDISSGQIEVSKDFNQSGGTVKVGGGKLNISGNYSLTSNALLNMTNPLDYVLVNGRFSACQGTDERNYLIAGTLEVKGDFIEGYAYGYNDYYYNFAASGTHKVVLSGSNPQNVNISYAPSSGFNILDTSKATKINLNTSIGLKVLGAPTDLSKVSNLKLVGSMSLEKDLTLNLNLTVSGNLEFNGHSLTVNGDSVFTGGDIKLSSGKLNINGAFTQSGGVINADSAEINALKDFNQCGGTMNVNGGRLNILGNYILSRYSLLNMTNSSDYIFVNGSFTASQETDERNHLTDGVLEVKGDFIQNYTWWSNSDNARYNFAASGRNKVLLSGTKAQNIYFSAPGTSTINILDTRQATSVNVATAVNLLVIDGMTDLSKVTSINLVNLNLDKDITLNLNLTISGNLVLNEHSLTVNGDFLLKGGNAKLSGGNLNINGLFTQDGGVINADSAQVNVLKDFNQYGGTMNVNGGRLNISGNYTLSRYSLLNMTNSSDYIFVNGSFTASQETDERNHLTDGVLEVKGDFIQNYTWWSNSDNARYNFAASGRNKVLLSGTKAQNIYFSAPGTSTINILDTRQATSVNVATAVNLLVIDGMTDLSKVTSINLVNLNLDKDITLNLNLTISGNLVLNEHSLTVNGDFLLKGGNAKLSGGKLNINGAFTQDGGVINADSAKINALKDFNQYGGTMNVNGGRLNILGNYTLSRYSLLNMTNPSDYIFVNGSFTASQDTDERNYLTDGVLEVKGDFNQIYNPTFPLNHTIRAQYNFAASGRNKIILSGGNPQKLGFSAPGTSTINILDTSQATSINVASAVNMLVIDGMTDLSKVTSINLVNLNLDKDITLNLNLTISGNLVLNEHSLTVNGDFVFKGENAKLSGGKLNINGVFTQNEGVINADLAQVNVLKDFNQWRGTMNVNGGKFNILGNYTLSLNSLLNMTNSSDYIFVNGSFTASQDTDERNYLTDGVLEVKGDFNQIYNPTFPLNHTSRAQYNFATSGNHKVILSGSNPQKLGFSSRATSKFNILELRNKGEIKGTLSVNTLITNNCALSTEIWTLYSDVVVYGDLTLSNGGSLNLNNYTINVNGDFYQLDSSQVNVSTGDLKVQGNYNIFGSSYLGMKDSGYIFVLKNFNLSSTSFARVNLSSGIFELKGNLTRSGTKNSFYCSGTNLVLLSGDSIQNIDANYGTFQSIDASFSIGVNFSSTLIIKGDLAGFKNIKNNDKLTLINSNINLREDISLNINMHLLNTNLNLNGYTLTINKDLNEYQSNINKNGGTLNVLGKHLVNGEDLNNPRDPLTSPTLASFAYYFGLGMKDAFAENAKNIWNFMMDPAKGIANLAEGIAFLAVVLNDPVSPQAIMATEVMVETMTNLKNDFVNGDANVMAKMIGRVFGEAIVFVIGDKGASIGFKLLKESANTGKLASLISACVKGETTGGAIAVEISKGSAEILSKIKNAIKSSTDDLNKIITKVYSRTNGVVDAEVVGVGKVEFEETVVLEGTDQICKDRFTKWIEGKLLERAAEVISKLKYTLRYSIEELAFQIKKVISIGEVTVVDLGNGVTYSIREAEDVAEAARPAYREVIQGIWKYSGKSADEIADFYFSKVANKTKVSGKFSGSASDILRAELKDAGVITPPYKHQAHHIIPEGMDVPELNEVRAIMQKYGVDLNSASNGVFLPDAPNLPHAGSATVHSGSHTSEYARYVADYIKNGNPQSADEVTELLNDLRTKLLNGTLKLNSL